MDRTFFKKALGAFAVVSVLTFTPGLMAGDGSAAAQSLQDLINAANAPKPQTPFSTASLAPADAVRSRGGIFNTTEISSKSFRALPQWSRVVKKMRAEEGAFKACLKNSAHCKGDAMKSWRNLILTSRNLDRKSKLNAVNKFFNRWPYKMDTQLYGTVEYWASPSEFMRRSGDCEDYSIAKFFALKHLGFKSSEMRVVILMDNIRNTGHAVLAVYQGRDILILDSLSNIIFSHAKYRHYVPQYSMNESTRWAHVKGDSLANAAGS